MSIICTVCVYIWTQRQYVSACSCSTYQDHLRLSDTHTRTRMDVLMLLMMTMMRLLCLHMAGDRLLEVDGSNLRAVTHQQAVECLKRTEEVSMRTDTHTHTRIYTLYLL